jgi:NTP pyrophosphatase (non-canonical NTP hydrolase)|tara:strand:- start:325 stop:591 length:267 start_codon:yes stop_codon:yes gene_type:complete
MMSKDALLQLMVITMEECGELVQACSKAIRKDNHRDNQLLKEEIGDVYAMIQLLVKFDIVSWDELDERVKVKNNKLSKWSELIDDEET